MRTAGTACGMSWKAPTHTGVQRPRRQGYTSAWGHRHSSTSSQWHRQPLLPQERAAWGRLWHRPRSPQAWLLPHNTTHPTLPQRSSMKHPTGPWHSPSTWPLCVATVH